MKAQIVRMDLGSQFTDGKQRVTLRVDKAESMWNHLSLTLESLGLIDAKLGDEFEICFIPQKEHHAAKTEQVGSV